MLAGRVVDAFGDPVMNARILIETRTSETTTRGVASTDTDDRGEYRVARLPAGDYLVAMLRQQAMMLAQGPRTPEFTYYPGSTTSAADAEVIHLDDAEEREAVDFVVAIAPPPISPVMAMRMQQAVAARQRPAVGSSIVRGRVTTPGGTGVAHAHVFVRSGADPLQTRAGRSDAEADSNFATSRRAGLS